jgi:hypothetical protein
VLEARHINIPDEFDSGMAKKNFHQFVFFVRRNPFTSFFPFFSPASMTRGMNNPTSRPHFSAYFEPKRITHNTGKPALLFILDDRYPARSCGNFYSVSYWIMEQLLLNINIEK